MSLYILEYQISITQYGKIPWINMPICTVSVCVKSCRKECKPVTWSISFQHGMLSITVTSTSVLVFCEKQNMTKYIIPHML